MDELKKQDNITVKESGKRWKRFAKNIRQKFRHFLLPEQKAQMEKNKEEREGKE